ncbi:hypothetical protein [Nonlabens marinus]|uniref:hypothetical protein n=1 Tax=Nonlabens marinus TaxID=930802 RepID=UPI0006986F7F|nr:hypothetical protein [Nonlabens marinus]
MRQILTILFIVSVISTSAQKRNHSNDTLKVVSYKVTTVHEVSLINLIATPEKFDGKSLSVKGFLQIEYESSRIYLNKADYEAGITSNSIWVNPDELSMKKILKNNCNGHYVVLDGKFRVNSDHSSIVGSGELDDITRVYRLD